MKKLCILPLLLIGTAFAANEPVKTNDVYPIDIGGTKLNLPTPRGTIRITPDMNELYIYTNKLNEADSANLYYASYIDIESLKKGNILQCDIYTPKTAIDHLFSTTEIEKIKSIFRTQFKNIVQSQEMQTRLKDITQKQLDASPNTIGIQPAGFKLISYNVIFEDDITYFSTLMKSTSVKQLQKTITGKDTITGGILVVNGKLLNLHCSAETNDENNKWAKATVLAWRDQILEANKRNIAERTWDKFVELVTDNGWFRFAFLMFLIAIFKRIFIKKKI